MLDAIRRRLAGQGVTIRYVCDALNVTRAEATRILKDMGAKQSQTVSPSMWRFPRVPKSDF